MAMPPLLGPSFEDPLTPVEEEMRRAERRRLAALAAVLLVLVLFVTYRTARR